MKRYLPIILFLFIAILSNAQESVLSNLKTIQLQITNDTLAVDSLTIIPSSVNIIHLSNKQNVDTSFYKTENNLLIWRKPITNDSIQITYRTFPFDLNKHFQNRDSARILPLQNSNYMGFDFDPYEEEEKALVEFKGLDYNGSFARGISFGNSQNLVLNSNFNLQMAGKLGDDVEILAAISDNSIPLQAEGNTQQLQEFDKIFIQLKRKNTSLIAGDYELARPHSYFMNYYKKLQGATISNQTELFSKGILSTKFSGAVARGKFVRNNLQASEGNQGPYRLRGQEGERFIIVLAGTEKVYIDGQVMQRGIEKDYVIDYNRGDITFTNKRLITKDSRIIVEFEYSSQSFVRSMFAFNTDYKTKKFNLHLNLYSEQDGKNSVQQDLNKTERARLQAIGDNIAQAFTSGIDTIGENTNPISYILKDSLVDGILYDSVLVFSNNLDSARYTARFSFVGNGNGDYKKILSAANGQVFEWLAPTNGLHRGDYAPIVKLIAPQKLQLFTFGGEYQLSKKSSISTEIALSSKDKNRFSKLDQNDNNGIAFTTNYHHETNLGKNEQPWKLETNVNYEFVQTNFNALNPYRSAEFNRDWNLRTSSSNVENSVIKSSEHIAKANFNLTKNQLGNLNYEFGSFFREGFYTGYKHLAKASFEKHGYHFDFDGSYLLAKTILEQSQFFRPKLDFNKSFQKLHNWKLGFYTEQEKNQRFDLPTDTLKQNSFFYQLYRFYLQSPEKQKFSFGANYTRRLDYAAFNNNFTKNTLADELNLNGQWAQKKSSRLQWNLTYRQLQILAPKLSSQQAQETYLGRMAYQLNLYKGAIRFNNTYEISSGQEPKVEFNYLEVNQGEGVYTWIDRNRDSIPQINEFEISPFQDQARFIRVSVLTNDFIRTNNVQLNQSLRLQPKALWYKAEGFKKLLSKFSTQSTLKIIRRAKAAADVSAWNPFQLNIIDTSLVSISSSIRNALFFNRADPKYDLQIGMFDNRNRIVLTTGFESRKTAEQFLRGRWNLSQQFSSQIYFATGQRDNDSEFFGERDYNIQFLKLEPQLTWQPNKDFRMILFYKFRDSKNSLAGETAIHHDFKLESTFNQSSKSSIRSSFSFVNINFDGARNTPVEFAMLEGLQNGKNFLWNLSFDRLLANNVQLSISYEGRKTGEAKVIHVGRAQVRATF